MDFIFRKAGFDENAKLGLLREAVMEHSELSQFVLYKNLLDHIFLKASVLSFVSAKDAFSAGSSSSSLTTVKIMQLSDVGRHKIEDKADAFGSQHSDHTLIVKNSHTVPVLNSERTSDKVCSYCQRSGHFSRTSSKNEHRKTRCAFCGKLRHSGSPCLKKQKKESQASSAEPSPTVGVILLEYDDGSASTEDLMASIKRIADSEALMKHAEHGNESHSTSIQS